MSFLLHGFHMVKKAVSQLGFSSVLQGSDKFKI